MIFSYLFGFSLMRFSSLLFAILLSIHTVYGQVEVSGDTLYFNSVRVEEESLIAEDQVEAATEYPDTMALEEEEPDESLSLDGLNRRERRARINVHLLNNLDYTKVKELKFTWSRNWPEAAMQGFRDASQHPHNLTMRVPMTFFTYLFSCIFELIYSITIGLFLLFSAPLWVTKVLQVSSFWHQFSAYPLRGAPKTKGNLMVGTGTVVILPKEYGQKVTKQPLSLQNFQDPYYTAGYHIKKQKRSNRFLFSSLLLVGLVLTLGLIVFPVAIYRVVASHVRNIRRIRHNFETRNKDKIIEVLPKSRRFYYY